MDWDADVLAALHDTFAEAGDVQYTRAGAPGPLAGITGIFSEGPVQVDALSDPTINAVAPVLGVRLSQFPADYDPRAAKGDTFIVRGITYRVRTGRPDSFGGATLEATRA